LQTSLTTVPQAGRKAPMRVANRDDSGICPRIKALPPS
jgi:hypothetical protein